MGLWAIQIAKAIFPGIHVVIADISDSKFQIAKIYGADETILWDKSADPGENAAAILETGTVDAVVDFCSYDSTFAAGLKSLGKNGAASSASNTFDTALIISLSERKQ